jgi:hypothetical protein
MGLEELAVTLSMLGINKYQIFENSIQLSVGELMSDPELAVSFRKLLVQYNYHWEYLYYAKVMRIFK